MKEKSYSELMKASVMNRKQLKESFVMDLYIDMFLFEIQLNSKRDKLLENIDLAIDKNDKQSFLKLSKELNALNKSYGT